MKTISMEEIYADPHVLDPLLAAGEPVGIMREGKDVGRLNPSPEKEPLNEAEIAKALKRVLPTVPAGEKPGVDKEFRPFNVEEHRAWMLATYGPDAFKSTRSVMDIIDYARRDLRISQP